TAVVSTSKTVPNMKLDSVEQQCHMIRPGARRLPSEGHLVPICRDPRCGQMQKISAGEFSFDPGSPEESQNGIIFSVFPVLLQGPHSPDNALSFGAACAIQI